MTLISRHRDAYDYLKTYDYDILLTRSNPHLLLGVVALLFCYGSMKWKNSFLNPVLEWRCFFLRNSHEFN